MAGDKKYVSVLNDGSQDLYVKDAEAAKQEGYYPSLRVGSADNLVVDSREAAAYTLRMTAGGDREVLSSGAASITQFEGIGCVWNQLVKNPNIDGTTYILSNTTISASDNVLEVTPIGSSSAVRFQGERWIEGHKYFVGASIKLSAVLQSGYISIRDTRGNDNLVLFDTNTTEWQVKNIIHTAIDSDISQSYTFYLFGSSAVQDKYYLKDIKVIDLTLLGIDTLTTPEQVEEWLAKHVGTKPYYPYEAGRLLSSNINGLYTVGQNLLDPISKTARLMPYTYTGHDNEYTIKNLPDGATVTFTPDSTGIASSVSVSNSHFTITERGTLTLSAATNDTYVCATYDEAKDDDVVPYTKHEYPFDVTNIYGKLNGAGEYVQVFPNGMRGAGSVKDTLNLSKAEAVVNVWNLDLGEVSYATYDSDLGFNLYSPAGYTPSKVTNYADRNKVRAICGRYPYNTTNGGWGSTFPNKTMSMPTSYFGRISIKDDSYNGDNSAFKTAMSGVMLYYELATPLVYTDCVYRDNGVDTPINLLSVDVDNWGTEGQDVKYADGAPQGVSALVTAQYGIDVAETSGSLPHTFVSIPELERKLQGKQDKLIAGDDLVIDENADTISHDEVERTNTTSSASPAHGDTFTAVDSVTTSDTGHVTGVNTKTVTLPSVSGKEDVSNKTTTISSSSTDTQYPSAKAVYTELQGKADIDGHYPSLKAGSAENLVSIDTFSDTFLTRPTGGYKREIISSDGVLDKPASVQAIGGIGVAWNQFVRNGNFEDSNYWNANTGTIAIGNNACVLTPANGVGQLQNIIGVYYAGGHKMYCSIYAVASGDVGSVILRIGGTDGVAQQLSTTKKWISSIITTSTSHNSMYVKIANAGANTITFYYAKCIDLTLLGIDNLTTTAEVEAWLAANIGTKPYYPYNEGTLLPAKLQGYKTTGKSANLLNPTTRTARLFAYTYDNVVNKFTIKNLPTGATLSFVPDATGVSETITPDANGQFVVSGSGTLTVSGSADLSQTWLVATYDGALDDYTNFEAWDGKEYPFDVTKVYGKAAGSSTYTQVFPNGMRAAGEARDVLNLMDASADVLFSSIKAKDLSWSVNNTFRATVSGIKQVAAGNNLSILCSKYNSAKLPGSGRVIDKMIGQYSNTNDIMVKDSAYTYDASGLISFTTALQSENVELFYELATPLHYTDCVYRDNGVDTPLSELNILVNNWAYEEVEIAQPSTGETFPVSCAPSITTKFGLDAAELVNSLPNIYATRRELKEGLNTKADNIDYAGSTHGLVPPAGEGNTGKYLKNDGTWDTPDGESYTEGNGIDISNNAISVDTTDTNIQGAIASGSTKFVQSGTIYTALDGKVDKVSGKGLSTEDYTTAEKTKLAGIEDEANAYSHPTYTAKTVGENADKTLTSGGTFKIPYLVSDTIGHVGSSTKEVTLTMPTIPAAQVQSDWNATSGMGVILNKPTIPVLPTLATVATTGSYTDLNNIPYLMDSEPIELMLTEDSGKIQTFCYSDYDSLVNVIAAYLSKCNNLLDANDEAISYPDESIVMPITVKLHPKTGLDDYKTTAEKTQEQIQTVLEEEHDKIYGWVWQKDNNLPSGELYGETLGFIRLRTSGKDWKDATILQIDIAIGGGRYISVKNPDTIVSISAQDYPLGLPTDVNKDSWGEIFSSKGNWRLPIIEFLNDSGQLEWATKDRFYSLGFTWS